MRNILRFFDRIEPCLFLVITLINLLPVILVKYFTTVDGPAHLYNARLMTELISYPAGVLSKYFVIANLLPTNITDHYFFMLTGYFLPGFLSEKLLLLFYLAGLPYAFRYFIRSVRPEGMYLSYFIFPFTYSFLFFYGFFNFHIALVFFLISITYLKKYYEHPVVMNSVVLLILATVVYISHAFVFIILLIYFILYHFRDIKLALSENPGEDKDTAIGRLILMVLVAAPGIVLMIISAFKTQSVDVPAQYIDFSQRLKWIRQLQPAKGILYHREDIYTIWLFYLLVFLTIATLYTIFIDQVRIAQGRLKVFLKKNKSGLPEPLLLIISMIILALYLILPDMSGGYGFISSRLLVFFFLFFIAWIATANLNAWIRIAAVLVIITMNTFMLNIYITESRKLDVSAREIEKAATYIKPYSTVLPVNESEKWIYGHFSNYLGIEKPMVILENYEAGLDYFPVNWNFERMPRLLFGETDSISSCLNWKSQMKNDAEAVQYILLINNMEFKDDPCTAKVKDILDEFYTPVFTSENLEIELYQLKSR